MAELNNIPSQPDDSSHSTRAIILRWVVFLVTAGIILYFVPGNDGRQFTYEINRPWAYSLLTAPFDIPVNLDSVRAREVKDSLEATFEPVYRRDDNSARTSVSLFSSRLNGASNLGLTAGEKSSLIAEVKRIYDNGIVDPDTYSSITSQRLPRVRMIRNNEAISVNSAHFLSPRRAYARIDSIFHDERLQNAISATNMAELLTPNVVMDTVETQRLHDDLMLRATAPIGVIQQGERIIDKGDIVTPRLFTILQTYEDIAAKNGSSQVRHDYTSSAGRFLYIALILGALYGYLFFFRPAYYFSRQAMLMLMSVIAVFTLVAFAMSQAFTSGLFVAPFTLVPIVLVVFLDSRTAFFSHIVTVMLATLVANFPMEFIFVQFVGGVVAIDSIKELSRRSQLVRTALLVMVSYVIAYTAVELIHSTEFSRASLRMLGYFAVNAVFISFAYVVIFVIEKFFGFTSKVTLVELSDTNSPLLRELSEECPGTFQHSMSVSNLAAAAAQRIGANTQLVRAGALYHDVGKINNPAFFTENQHGVNPHDALSPEQSARIVIGHVTDGLRRAEKAKLPTPIKNFISEHHGTGKARYFYNTWCNTHPGETPDESLFTYPGPNPQSRETSILMMADAVEAASRSLTDHSPEAIAALVNRIIDYQISEGLHNESTLSFRDVLLIKDTFASRLRTMFHSRVSYPELKRTESSQSSINPKP